MAKLLGDDGRPLNLQKMQKILSITLPTRADRDFRKVSEDLGIPMAAVARATIISFLIHQLKRPVGYYNDDVRTQLLVNELKKHKETIAEIRAIVESGALKE